MQLESYVTAEYLPGTGMTSGIVFGRALSALRDGRIGPYALSFPQARDGGPADPTGGKATGGAIAARRRPTVGDRFQVFGARDTIHAATAVLSRFADYLVTDTVRTVSPTPRYVCFQRLRASAEWTPAAGQRQLRRLLRRVEQDPARTLPPDAIRRCLEPPPNRTHDDHPFLLVNSHTTGQRFSLIFRVSITDQAVDGDFDSYGFGVRGATVPLL